MWTDPGRKRNAVSQSVVRKFGALFFDDPGILGRGWLCEGEGYARRLGREGLAELATDTVWLTNLGFNESYATGLSNNSRFLGDSYLREKITRICSEYGISEAQDQTEFASLLFSRVMRTSRMILGRENFKPQYALKQGFRDFVGSATDDIVATDTAKHLQEAMRYSANCLTTDREGETLWLRVPQRTHCLSVLDMTLPKGEFRRIPKSRLPPPKTDRGTVERWFMQTIDGGARPGLFRIVCSNFRPEFNKFINFGDGGMSPYRAICNERQWVTSNEMISLLVFSDVTLFEGLVAERTHKLDNALALVSGLPAWTVLSLTMSIIYDNIWIGMARDRKGCGLKTPAGKTVINADAPFLRSQDLQLLFQKACTASLHGQGLDVRGYASGSIRIAGKNTDPMAIWEACLDGHLLPPFLHIPKEKLPDPFHEAGDLDEFFKLVRDRPDLALKTVQILRATNSLDILLALDAYVLRKLRTLYT